MAGRHNEYHHVLRPERQVKYKTEKGDWALKIKGEGIASDFHCRGLGMKGQFWWITKHAANDRYDKVKKHAKIIANKCFVKIIKEQYEEIERTVKSPEAWVRYLMAATVKKCSNFTLKENLCQPYRRSHRQALAKFLCGDLMLGRITKHWYCREQRVNGMPEGCIDCFREKNSRVIESEEHLIFDCVTTREIRVWF